MPQTAAPDLNLDRTALLERFDTVRRRSADLFDVISDDAYYSRPIALRNPIVFYEGHLAAFAVNTLLKKALGGPAIDANLEVLFARGIDPEHEVPEASLRAAWPSRERVRAYVLEADRRLRDALATAALSRPGHPLLDRAEAAFTILEHEEMHQETLQYIWHRLPFEQKRRPAGAEPVRGRPERPAGDMVRVSAGAATLGARRDAIPFGWDNEFPECEVHVPAFSVDRHDVTNGDFLAFVEDGGYSREDLWDPDAWQWRSAESRAHPLFWERHDGAWYWRAMFELVPLPPAWPVYVSQAEAQAYARWRGCRLPTEAEFHRAAYGAPDGSERQQPWGSERPAAEHGNFGNRSWDPVPAGTHPGGASAFGVHDLVGNGWEWTSTPFRPFPGFTAMASYPEYSADFFDDRHFVLKGASPATPTPLVRRSFRNWFRPHYPYVYATFRCARD
jgi:gamma-glutamyl hercynylcysteine S-oxide synthase